LRISNSKTQIMCLSSPGHAGCLIYPHTIMHVFCMQDTETPTTKPQGRGKSSNSILSFDICLLYVVLRMQTCCSGVCRTYIFRCGFCDLINGNRNKTCCRPTRLTPARYSSTVYRGMRHCVSVRVCACVGGGEADPMKPPATPHLRVSCTIQCIPTVS